MTKRLLSFVLALIMVIGVLPIATYAASAMPKVDMKDANGNISQYIGGSSSNWYVAIENTVDRYGTVTESKLVRTTTQPKDNYIQYNYDGVNSVLYITFNNVNYVRATSAKAFMDINANSGYSSEFEIVITLNGTNKLSGTGITFNFNNEKDITITGTGSLDVNTYLTSQAIMWSKSNSNFIVLDTTLKLYNSHGYIDAVGGTIGGIVAKNSIIIDGANVNINAGKKSAALKTAAGISSTPTSPADGITIKNNANVVLEGGSVILVQTNGPILFDNSTISMTKGTGNKQPVFNRAPKITGSYSSTKAGYGELDRNYPGNFGLQPGDILPTNPDSTDAITNFELVHKHVPSDCTKESLCLCGKATAPATAEKHSLEYVEALEVTCAQNGWDAYEYCENCAYSTKVEIPATGKHTLAYAMGQAATCGEPGWKTYEYCAVCDYTTKVEIPATGNHKIVQAPAQAPSCGNFGWDAHEYCANCSSYTTQVPIPATGDHDLVYVEAKEATLTEAGWDAYRYCKNCDFSTKEEIPATGIVTLRPFYAVNGDVPQELRTYLYEKPDFYTSTFKTGQTVPTVSWGGTSNIASLAAKLKAEFDDRPVGTRYFKLDAMSKTMHALVEHNVYYDKPIEAVRNWLEAFLEEYYKIGGKLDGIQVDVEYVYGSSWYIHLAQNEKNPSAVHNDPNIYWNIVNDERYATEIRPMLVKMGFPFLEKSKQDDIKSEIYNIRTQGSTSSTIWNAVNSVRMAQAIDEAVYEPLIKYYPNAWVTDYQVRDVYGWQKALNSSATPLLGNRIGIGTTSNFNSYSVRPNASIYGSPDDDGNRNYTTPPSYNGAAYELNAFNTTLWELNILKTMYEATESKRIGVHVGYFNYNPNRKGTYANTPYYSETLMHIALLDPVAYMCYIREVEVFGDGKNSDNPLIGDFVYNLSVVHDIFAELTRVAGASDRKVISIPATWNSDFILSGMYSGGRNIWRITPNTYTGVSLEQFKIKDKAPTFYINGQTIIFPQGRIITDGKVRQVGTCGYWVETPAGVEPIIINDTDRYSKFPSFLENFEDYTTGTTFNSDTALPANCWNVSGISPTIRLNNSSKTLALSQSGNMSLTMLPKNITAGDSYAMQQAWEVTVTIPSSGQLTLLTCSSQDTGIRIADGKVYYAFGNNSLQLSGVNLTAGNTYTFKREVNFNTKKASYFVYDVNGKLLGSIKDQNMPNVSTPVTQIGFSWSSISSAAYMDNFKMYPIGVTTVLEVYDAETGLKVSDPSATRTADSAYRLSWMNASSEYKVAKIYNNSTLLAEVKMAPGQDGVITDVVKGNNIRISVVTEDGTAETYPDYDKGDFSWTSVAESIGLATGNSTVTTYTVEFKDWDGTVLSSKSYQRGETVTTPVNPTRQADDTYSYTFAGWDKQVVKCEADATYTATYSSTYIDYTVTFQNWDGTVLSAKTYHYGDKIVAPENPSRPAEGTKTYAFTGWDKAVSTCTGSTTYTAVYATNSVVPDTITSSTYQISNGTISKISANTTVSAFLSKINEGQYAKVYNGTQEVSPDSLIATGMIIRLQDGSYSKVSATIVVTGDTNGDGKITVTDMLAVKAHILKKSTLSNASATAADTSGDNAISITDFIQLKAHILGKSNIAP